MKKYVKISLSLLLATIMAFSFLGIGTFAATRSENANLRFNSNGKFKIMQIADIQDNYALSPITKDHIIKALETDKPDLIVLTGDNIAGNANTLGVKAIDKSLVSSAIDKFMKIFADYKIPVAAVFGNHDAEAKITREEQMAMYMKYSNFIGYDEGSSISGCGTYNVPIYSKSDASKIAYNLWMIDSNMYDDVNGGYDHVKQDQLDWIKSKDLEIYNANGPVNSMVFQHIVVPEIFDALLKVPAGTKGAVAKDGKYYILNPEITRAGVLHETPCPGTINSGEFATMQNLKGKVDAMFFGHDHKNTFEILYKGIDLVNSPTVGFASYGDRDTRGVRIITIDENTNSYTTNVLRYFDMFTDDASLYRYNMYSNEDGVFPQIGAAFQYFFVGILWNTITDVFYDIFSFLK